MNITCNKHELSETAARIARIVPSTSPLPTLSGILMKADSRGLSMTGYDLEIGISKTIDASVSEGGEAVFDARLFCDIVRRLPDDTVKITVDDKLVCEIFSGKAHFSLMGMKAADYPELPTVDMGEDISLPAEVLGSMVRQTVYAVSPANANRPMFTGLLYELEEGTLNVVGIDGFRMAIRTEKVAFDGNKSFVVPAKTMNEVTKLLPDEGEVTLTVTNRHIIFTVDGFSVVSRLLIGEPTNYRAAIPSSVESTVNVNTREMISSVERVSQIINERIKTTPLRCKFEDNLFSVSCNSALGSAQDEIEINMQGSPVERGFNNRFLLDALRATESDEVIFQFGGAKAPLVIRPVGSDSFLFIIMPVDLKR